MAKKNPLMEMFYWYKCPTGNECWVYELFYWYIYALWATNVGCTNCSIDINAIWATNVGCTNCSIDIYALQAIAYCGVPFSIDINALQATNVGCTNCSIDINALWATNVGCTNCSIDIYALWVGCKKLWVLLKYLRSDFVVNVLRTKQYIHRIRSIDIISI